MRLRTLRSIQPQVYDLAHTRGRIASRNRHLCGESSIHEIVEHVERIFDPLPVTVIGSVPNKIQLSGDKPQPRMSLRSSRLRLQSQQFSGSSETRYRSSLTS